VYLQLCRSSTLCTFNFVGLQLCVPSTLSVFNFVGLQVCVSSTLSVFNFVYLQLCLLQVRRFNSVVYNFVILPFKAAKEEDEEVTSRVNLYTEITHSRYVPPVSTSISSPVSSSISPPVPTSILPELVVSGCRSEQIYQASLEVSKSKATSQEYRGFHQNDSSIIVMTVELMQPHQNDGESLDSQETIYCITILLTGHTFSTFRRNRLNKNRISLRVSTHLLLH
jgi:hypothetical protein